MLDQRFQTKSQSTLTEYSDEKPSETVIDDDGHTYEIVVIANDFEEKSVPVESEFEEFELLEVDNGDANNGESHECVTQNDDQSLPLSSEMVQAMDIVNASDNENVQNQEYEYKSKSNSSNDSRRKHKSDMKVEVHSIRKSARQAAKLQKSQHFKIKKEQTKSFVTKRKADNSITKASEENFEIEEMQQDCDDIAEGESDNEFPARDSDNEDWPSQETLDEFPKQFMKNGLLLYKGKELMSMICRYIFVRKKNNSYEDRVSHDYGVFFIGSTIWSANNVRKNPDSSELFEYDTEYGSKLIL